MYEFIHKGKFCVLLFDGYSISSKTYNHSHLKEVDSIEYWPLVNVTKSIQSINISCKICL